MSDIPYITGGTALNVPHPVTHDVADWHTEGMVRSGKVIVTGQNGIVGAPGLEEGDLLDISDFIKRRGLSWPTHLCATPERAILDIVYRSAVRSDAPAHHLEIDDLMVDVNKQRLARRIRAWLPELTPRQQAAVEEWMRNNGLPEESHGEG
jgi:hypothetical protein